MYNVFHTYDPIYIPHMERPSPGAPQFHSQTGFFPHSSFSLTPFDIIFRLSQKVMCEITVWPPWEERDPFWRGQGIKLVSSLGGNEALD